MPTPRSYRLIARIAESDAAETWRGVATGQSGTEPATLKILNPRAAFPEVLSELAARSAATGKLKHPSLIVPWELGSAGDRTVLASRHVLGHDLEIVFQRLRSREVKLTVSRAVHLVAEAANAVSALHLAGLVHGSLGPSDLFVGFDGSVRVSCAGLRPSLELSQRTKQMATRGRRAYRAPELSRNAATDAYADVYALGAIVYELTTGKSLEEAGPRGTSTRSDSLTPPSRIDRRVPMTLDAVIMRALETARTRRYKDAAELREALWGHLDEMGDVVTPADLAAFAASVLPNEVVQKDFDPEEAVVGTPPIPGTFELTPLPTSGLPLPVQAAAVVGVPIPAGTGTGDEDAPAAEATVRIEVARVAGAPQTDPEAGGPETAPEALPAAMPSSAPDLSNPEAAPAPASLEPPPGMLTEAPPEESQVQRGDVFSQTVKMATAPAQLAVPANGASAAPGTDTEALSPAFDDLPELEATGRGPATELDTPPPDHEPAGSRRLTEAHSRGVPARRKIWPWLLVAGAAPILVAIGFILGRHDPEPSDHELAALEAGLTALETDPVKADPPPVDPPPPSEAAGSESPEPESDPTGVEAATPPPPTPTKVETEVEPRKVNTRARNGKRKKGRRGRLSIVASHRARVYIDGKDTGRFTPLKGYLLPTGRHVVTLIQPSTGMTQKRRVNIRAGGRVNLKIRFR